MAVIIAIDDAVGVAKGSVIGISLVPLRSFIAPTMLLRPVVTARAVMVMVMILKRLGS